MGTQDSVYIVKVGSLLQRLDLGAMDLVRICGIGVKTAYQAQKGDSISLDTCLRIYVALKNANFDVKWEDVVEVK